VDRNLSKIYIYGQINVSYMHFSLIWSTRMIGVTVFVKLLGPSVNDVTAGGGGIKDYVTTVLKP
jgi:hypothetical protein